MGASSTADQRPSAVVPRRSAANQRPSALADELKLSKVNKSRCKVVYVFKNGLFPESFCLFSSFLHYRN